MWTKFLAFLAVLALFAVVWLYTREFHVLSNTIAGNRLVWGALSFGALFSVALIWFFRQRFKPWEKHRPEVFLLFFSLTLIMPLLASLLNRSGGAIQHRSFVFLSEKPFAEAGYGVLKGEVLKPTGYFLLVKDHAGNAHRFRYKQQAYYPMTKAGEAVLLPMRKGLLGFEYLDLD
ncbi:MAG: hypothetical protein ACOYNO_06190 [Saprospiraceae bacterium]